MISKANLGQQLALPRRGRGLMHSQLSTHCPFLGAGGLGDKRYRGVSLDPPPPPTPVFFFPREQQALLAQSEMKSINSSPSSTGKGRLGK